MPFKYLDGILNDFLDSFEVYSVLRPLPFLFRIIGVALDGSHFFRRYSYGIELIQYILNKDKNNRVVIIGDGWEDGQGYVKVKPHDKILNLQGKTTIRQMINIVHDLDSLIAVDTGILHVGLALHVPSVGVFSIIDPKLRISYYTGSRDVVYMSDMECLGCGSWHMAKCPHGDTRNDPDFIPPCLKITPEEICNKLTGLKKSEALTLIGEPIKKVTVNIKRVTDIKLTMQVWNGFQKTKLIHLMTIKSK